MGLTPFPNGISSFGYPILPTMPGGPPLNAAPSLTQVGTGNPVSGPPVARFVSSTIGADGNAGTHMKTGGPLATWSKALALSNPGDLIYLMPGHVENITAANGIDVTTKDVHVIGMGAGNQRPLIVFKTATTATFRVNATTGDGFYLYNVVFQSQVANLALCFDVAAKDVTFDTVDYVDNGTHDVAIGFRVTGVNVVIKNCSWQLGVANASVLQWITLNGAHGARILGNFGHFEGLATANPANGVIVGVTALSKRVYIAGNTACIANGGNASVTCSLFTGTTGSVAYNNWCSAGKTAIAGINAIASCEGYQNFVTHTVNKSGLLDPVVDV